jgi:hypothetical protein
MQYDPDFESNGMGLLLLAVDGHEFERLLVLDMEHLAIGAVIFSHQPSMQARMYMFAQFYVPWNGDEAVWLRTDRQWPTAWIYNERNVSYTDPEFLIGTCIENLSPELHEPDFVVSWTWRPDPPLWLCSHSDCLDHELFERSGATSSHVTVPEVFDEVTRSGTPFWVSLMPDPRFINSLQGSTLAKHALSVEGIWGAGIYLSLEAHSSSMPKGLATYIYPSNPVYVVIASHRVLFENFHADHGTIISADRFDYVSRPPGPPDVCLGFISWNRLRLLDMTVHSTLEHLQNVEPLVRYEMVWVDNGSQNQTERSIILNKFEWDKPLLLHKNRGLPFALNRIYDLCEAPYTPRELRVASPRPCARSARSATRVCAGL